MTKAQMIIVPVNHQPWVKKISAPAVAPTVPTTVMTSGRHTRVRQPPTERCDRTRYRVPGEDVEHARPIRRQQGSFAATISAHSAPIRPNRLRRR